jgi:hypothetical protein
VRRARPSRIVRTDRRLQRFLDHRASVGMPGVGAREVREPIEDVHMQRLGSKHAGFVVERRPSPPTLRSHKRRRERYAVLDESGAPARAAQSFARSRGSETAPADGPSVAQEATTEGRTMRWMGLLVLLGSMAPLSARAAVFVVNDTNDLPRALLAPACTCASIGGGCTLRAAVQTSNTCAGADTIQLATATYVLSRAGSGEDMGVTGDLDIRGAVTIEGGRSQIDAAYLDRAIDVIGTHGSQVVLRDLVILHGASAAGEDGGCMRARNCALLAEETFFEVCESDASGGGLATLDSSVELVDCLFWADQANDFGGGLAADGGTVELTRTRLFANEALIGGGASFENDASYLIEDSELTDNFAGLGGGIGGWDGSFEIRRSRITRNEADTGGGIYCQTGSIYDSTIAENDAWGGGAGVYVDFGGTLEIWRSAIQYNTAVHHGGGVDAQGSVRAVNTTFAYNEADVGGAVYANGGFEGNNITVAYNSALTTGGIYVPSALPAGVFENSIVAHNSGGGCSNAHSTGWSMSASIACLGNTSDIQTSSTGLGSFGDHGGPTFTFPLLGSSPAIDTGRNASCATRDQRSVTRPQGPRCDMGAYEREP